VSNYLWPRFIGGPRDGEPLTVGEVKGRGWIHVPSMHGTDFYWPMQIAMSRDSEAERLVVYLHTDENSDEAAARVLGVLAREAGCEVIPSRT
jgi:hypothetical protein